MGDFITVDDRFLVSREGDVSLLKSLTDHEVLVGGELVMEAILSPGETIVTDLGEYRYIDPSAPTSGLTRFQWMLAALALAITALWMWPMIEGRRPAVSAPSASPVGSSPDSSPDAASEKVEARIARARLQFAAGEQWADEAYLNMGRLFWAIETWKDVERSLADLDPVPDVVERARTRRSEAEPELAAKKKFLENNATIAFRSGRNEEAEKILRVLLVVSQDPGDPAYIWALNHLQLVAGTGKKGS